MPPSSNLAVRVGFSLLPFAFIIRPLSALSSTVRSVRLGMSYRHESGVPFGWEQCGTSRIIATVETLGCQESYDAARPALLRSTLGNSRS